MNLTGCRSPRMVTHNESPPVANQVVAFRVRQPRARSVWLLGLIGAWHPSFVAMENQGNGLWTKKIELTAGDFSYRLIVDGSRIEAPAEVETGDSRGTFTRFFTLLRHTSSDDPTRSNRAAINQRRR